MGRSHQAASPPAAGCIDRAAPGHDPSAALARLRRRCRKRKQVLPARELPPTRLRPAFPLARYAGPLLFLIAGGQAAAAPLPVPGFRPAELQLAARAGKRSLVVGLHGNFDRPEWFCASLRLLVDGRAHLLCPRGIPRSDAPAAWDRWTFPARGRVLAELDAGIRALRARQPDRLADGPVLLGGFSLGAILASRLAVESPARFPRLYLVEGGQAVWTAPALRRFQRGGGKGMILGCGRRGCAAQSERICKQARGLGLICTVVLAPGLGHGYTEPLPRLSRSAFAELLGGSDHW